MYLSAGCKSSSTKYFIPWTVDILEYLFHHTLFPRRNFILLPVISLQSSLLFNSHPTLHSTTTLDMNRREMWRHSLEELCLKFVCVRIKKFIWRLAKARKLTIHSPDGDRRTGTKGNFLTRKRTPISYIFQVHPVVILLIQEKKIGDPFQIFKVKLSSTSIITNDFWKKKL